MNNDEKYEGATGMSVHISEDLDIVKFVKYSNDLIILSLITNDETADRNQVSEPTAWRTENNLELNTNKTVKIIVESPF